MFRIELLPAQQGDAIWIEYGRPAGRLYRVLIDGGTPATGEVIRERIANLPAKDRRFDLLVVTHVDTDHIGGILKLLSDLPDGLEFDDVWFNAWPQIKPPRSSKLGPVDGEILSEALRKLQWPWNCHFDGGAVAVGANAALPQKKLRGGMKLTVLSPGAPQIEKLRDEWKEIVRENGLDPGKPGRWKKLLELAARKGVKSSILGAPDIDRLARTTFEEDDSTANGSTIALLAEFGGKSCLLGGDAHPRVLLQSVQRLCRARKLSHLRVDAFKVPHHGSANNLDRDLLSAVSSSSYLFSTNGAVFGHPDDEAIARVIAGFGLATKTLYFNYPAAVIAKNYKKRKKRGAPDWNRIRTTLKRGWQLDYPCAGHAGAALEL